MVAAAATAAGSAVCLSVSSKGVVLPLRPAQGPRSAPRRVVVCTAEPAPRAPAATAAPPAAPKGPVTIEFQRQAAKQMIKYFDNKAYEKEVEDAKVFGWTAKNEIGNGRWSMFGLAVGLLTEYATGVDFVDQVKLMLANLGIVDFL